MFWMTLRKIILNSDFEIDTPIRSTTYVSSAQVAIFSHVDSSRTVDCVFCNVIGGEKFLAEKQSILMKPEESAGCHQTVFPRERVGSGHVTTGDETSQDYTFVS